jgi:phosphoenolpyruvate synthase/pyruvate phosphate dikinase
MDAIFAELSRRYSVPMTFFRYATTKEIMALKSGAVDVAAVVKRRKKMLYLCENKKGRFIPFTKIERTFNDLLAVEKVGNLNQVSGTTAYPGKVSGRVRILRDKMDVKKLKAGEVLVTFGTTPDFLPAMIKASAYVTEQGGVTSHAAIVAREMKKPCVIGTRIATKVFRDGELVEVDANRGIVRKIK